MSDRRYRQALGYLRARALLSGVSSLEEQHLVWLVDVLWSDPEDLAAVREVVVEVMRGYERDAGELVGRAEAVLAHAQRDWETPEEEARAVIEAHAKLTRLLGDAERLVVLERERGAAGGAVADARDRVSALMARLVEEGF